ncbi:General odorant-binding6d [Apis cerana cerana]|uniref:General odorant-binding6d n=1 Tax=Apis cerana cerana TaxID=94128 RepID=A0A2A3EEU5_APICC|nr:General odorant-binding6d [Apis cerana cerana]
MKTIIFIFAFCLVGILAVSEESITKLRKIESVCVEENGIDLQKADDVKKGIFDKNDEKLACYVDCMLKKVGFVNADTTFNEEKFRERTTKLDSEQTIEELKTKLHTEQSVCATETGIDQQKANDVIQGNVDVEDKKVQLYSECILKKFNVLDKNGVFKPQGIALVMELLIDENAVKQLLSECSTISEDNVYLKARKAKVIQGNVDVEDKNVQVYFTKHKCLVN